jgi:hypothetical protein
VVGELVGGRLLELERSLADEDGVRGLSVDSDFSADVDGAEELADVGGAEGVTGGVGVAEAGVLGGASAVSSAVGLGCR